MGARFQKIQLLESDIIHQELLNKQTIKSIELKMIMFLKKLNDTGLKNPSIRTTQNQTPEDDGPDDHL